MVIGYSFVRNIYKLLALGKRLSCVFHLFTLHLCNQHTALVLTQQ